MKTLLLTLALVLASCAPAYHHFAVDPHHRYHKAQRQHARERAHRKQW